MFKRGIMHFEDYNYEMFNKYVLTDRPCLQKRMKKLQKRRKIILTHLPVRKCWASVLHQMVKAWETRMKLLKSRL